jgi:hypothetical protein
MTDEAALLELDVQLEFNDYLRFQYYDSLRNQWWMIPLFLLGCSVSAVLLVVSAVNQDSYMLRDLVPFTSLLFLGGVFVLSGPYLTSRRDFYVKSSLRQMIRYRVYETHLGIINTRQQGKLAWSKVREVRETGSSFLVYVDRSGAFILPKHEFPGEGEIMSFRELAMVILGARKCRFNVGRVASHF